MSDVKYVVEHEYDDDGVCIHCGFDDAEFVWWRTTYEGKAMPHVQRPQCIERKVKQ